MLYLSKWPEITVSRRTHSLFSQYLHNRDQWFQCWLSYDSLLGARKEEKIWWADRWWKNNRIKSFFFFKIHLNIQDNLSSSFPKMCVFACVLVCVLEGGVISGASSVKIRIKCGLQGFYFIFWNFQRPWKIGSYKDIGWQSQRIFGLMYCEQLIHIVFSQKKIKINKYIH